MSATDYSQVIAGQTISVPSNAGSGILGPYTLYQLAQGQTAMVEAVTFTATGAAVLTAPVLFRLELCDPSNNVVFQQITPPFDFD